MMPSIRSFSRQHVQHERPDAASGCPVYQRGEQQCADSVLLPAVGHDKADIGSPAVVGGHAVTDHSAEAVGDEQDVSRGTSPAQGAKQSGARWSDRREEPEVLAPGGQVADKLANPVGIRLASCPQQPDHSNRGSIHRPSLALLAKSVK